MSLSRGEFLRSLAKSIPGMVFNSGAAVAAQKLLTKMAAASGSTPNLPVAAPQPHTVAAMDRVNYINRGPVEGNRVALTFDDGPHAGVTDRILDELKQRGTHATFFMIGQRIEAEPELARRVLAEGHDVGNHTYTHPKLPGLPNDKAEEEIRKTGEIMASMLNYHPIWFRPPYGELRPDQAGLVEKHGMRPVLGEISTGDWAQPGEEKILAKIAEATAGSIIICHDFSAQTANCIGRALDGLLERGLKPVALSSLLAAK